MSNKIIKLKLKSSLVVAFERYNVKNQTEWKLLLWEDEVHFLLLLVIFLKITRKLNVTI